MGAPKGNQYAVGNNGGAPTKYTPEIIQAALDYIEDYDEVHKHAIPSVQGMAIVLKVNESTLWAWGRDETKEFSHILKQCKSKQHFTLINQGLKGEFNSNITKLVLGKHGYHDKQDVEASFAVTIGEKDAGSL